MSTTSTNLTIRGIDIEVIYKDIKTCTSASTRQSAGSA